MRWFKLLIGIYFLIETFYTKNFLSGAIALFFLYQAAFNKNICWPNACFIEPNKPENTNRTVEFEEIK